MTIVLASGRGCRAAHRCCAPHERLRTEPESLTLPVGCVMAMLEARDAVARDLGPFCLIRGYSPARGLFVRFVTPCDRVGTEQLGYAMSSPVSTRARTRSS